MEKKFEIYKKDKLGFSNNSELKKYYSKRWKQGNYKGFVLHGINLSKIYDKIRKDSSFHFLNPQKEDIVLDAACGDGKFTLRVSRKAKEVYGVDVTKEAFNKSKGKRKNCFFREMNIEQMSFESGKFDKAVSIETLEHVLHPEKAIKGFYRVLKPNGKFVLCVPINSFMNNFLVNIKLRKYFSISEHLNEWKYKNVKKLLENNGFEIIKKRGIFFDLGLRRLLKNKSLTKTTINLQLAIKNFPSNSSWAVILCKKSYNNS